MRPPSSPYSPKCVEKKTHSRKFTVASGPPNSVQSTSRRHFAAPPTSKSGDLVVFVASSCSMPLRLATPQLPENFSSSL